MHIISRKKVVISRRKLISLNAKYHYFIRAIVFSSYIIEPLEIKWWHSFWDRLFTYNLKYKWLGFTESWIKDKILFLLFKAIFMLQGETAFFLHWNKSAFLKAGRTNMSLGWISLIVKSQCLVTAGSTIV